MDNNCQRPYGNSWNNSPNQQGYNQYPPQSYGHGPQGYGLDAQGYDPQGYDIYGFDRQGFDRQGYDRNGYDRNGYDRYGHPYNPYNPYPYCQQPASGYDYYGMQPMPHLVKAIFAIILFFPLGIPAIINSCKVNSLKNTDINAALSASRTANILGIIGIIVGSIFWFNILSLLDY